MIAEAMAEVRAGNAVIWTDLVRAVYLTDSLMTNARARPNSPVMNQFRGELADLRDRLALESEEREARDWRAGVERPET